MLTFLLPAATTIISLMSLCLHWSNYHRPSLQRYACRILLMPIIYSFSAYFSLCFPSRVSHVFTLVKDLYEPIVILAFFKLLLTYLSGGSSRTISYIFTTNSATSSTDISDPFTFLTLKRGVVQYVLLKPILTLVYAIMMQFPIIANSAFSIIPPLLANLSVCLSLYCLGVFWAAAAPMLIPFHPAAKFMCVKGILFFTFWQAVAVDIASRFGYLPLTLAGRTDPQSIARFVTDLLICIEMPFFSIAHIFAFWPSDFIPPDVDPGARFTVKDAILDTFGTADLLAGYSAKGLTYRSFKPPDETSNNDRAVRNRLEAGMRYRTGLGTYWLQDVMPVSDNEHDESIETIPLMFDDDDETDLSLWEEARKVKWGDWGYRVVPGRGLFGNDRGGLGSGNAYRDYGSIRS